MDKPDLIEVVSHYIELRKSGREYHGLAPCHEDHHPSLRVNPDKQLWYCYPCARGGDVISFVQLVEKVSFEEACEILKVKRKLLTVRNLPAKAPTLLADWLNNQYVLIGIRLRSLSRQIAFAQTLGDTSLLRNLDQEWEILAVLHDDLQNPAFAAGLWESRDSIEAITDIVEAKPLPEFPPLTDAYRAYLREIVR